MEQFSPDLQAWGVFITFEFASESLKNLRPGPQGYLLERLNIPVQELSEKECGTLEHQLLLLRECLSDMKHFYRQELAQLYFKSFSLELGSIMLSHREDTDRFTPHINKYDFITLGFLKLVSRYFSSEHTVDFYAESLCISTKYTNILYIYTYYNSSICYHHNIISIIYNFYTYNMTCFRCSFIC